MKLVNHKFTLSSIAAISASIVLSACNSFGTVFDGDRIDYKSAGNAKSPSLSVPPDLTKATGDRRYYVPGGVATLSEYNAGQKVSTANSVLPQTAGMQIRTDGKVRWLTVNKSPVDVWGPVRDFWQESGFILEVESPDTGLLETDWAENRAKIPQDFIRSTIGKVMDFAYSTAERDKFRTRIERNADGGTDIYVTHRGVIEELVGQQKDSTRWASRPADPDLEAEFLARIMTRLGMSKQEARAEVKAKPVNSPTATVASRVSSTGGTSVLTIAEPFDRAWRTVSVGIDRLNFTVEDRDRNKGTLLIRYVDPKNLDKQPGFLDRLFSGKSADDLKKAVRYTVALRGEGNNTSVSVLNDKNAPDTSDVGKRILVLLDEQTR